MFRLKVTFFFLLADVKKIYTNSRYYFTCYLLYIILIKIQIESKRWNLGKRKLKFLITAALLKYYEP